MKGVGGNQGALQHGPAQTAGLLPTPWSRRMPPEEKVARGERRKIPGLRHGHGKRCRPPPRARERLHPPGGYWPPGWRHLRRAWPARAPGGLSNMVFWGIRRRGSRYAVAGGRPFGGWERAQKAHLCSAICSASQKSCSIPCAACS